MNAMLDFIGIGFAGLWGTRSKRNIQKANIIYISSGIRAHNLSHHKLAPTTTLTDGAVFKSLKESSHINNFNTLQNQIDYGYYIF